MNFKKPVSALLSLSIVLSATLPAFSGTAVKQPASPKVTTWQEYVQKHPKIEVEYRYSNHAKPVLIAANGVKVKLPANSPVILKLNDTIKGNDSIQGTTVNFTVVNDVKVGNSIVVKAGSRAKAQVSMQDDNGIIGQSGKVLISDFGVQAVDGTFIPLQGSLSEKGKDKMIMSVGLAIVLCPLFLLMKGGEATLPAGMEKTTYTAADAEINVTQQ